MTEDKRTLKQNRALHLMFDHLSKELNDAGLDMKRTLKPEIDIPWSDRTVKEFIWRPVMEAQLGKKSTTELTTKDIDMVFTTINKHLGEKFGIEIEFPSIEILMSKSSNY
jgi:hypothetical protein